MFRRIELFYRLRLLESLIFLSMLIVFNGVASYAATIFSDDFSGSYPGSWSIGHDGGEGTYAWAWPYDYAHEYADPYGDRYYYPDDLHVYMERRNVNLLGYSQATLSFYYIVDTETTYDFFTLNVRDQSGSWHEMFRKSGPTDPLNWTYKEIDLSQFDGQNSLYIQFRFDSDGSVSGSPYAGVYIDNVVLTAQSPWYEFYDATINYKNDNDSDGYYSRVDIQWDADTSLSSASVYVKVYARSSSGTEYYIGQSNTYTIYGNEFDWYSYGITGGSHGPWDFRLELYKSDGTLVDRLDYGDDDDLMDVPLETEADDVANQAPTVTITSPNNGNDYTIDTSPVSISGTASDPDSNLDYVKVRNETTNTDYYDYAPSGASSNWSVSNVSLASGDNTIRVYCYDTSGAYGTDIININYTPEPERPSVVIIGIDALRRSVLYELLANNQLTNLGSIFGPMIHAGTVSTNGNATFNSTHTVGVNYCITAFPSFTFPSWATNFTGTYVKNHGITGNGWFDRTNSRFYGFSASEIGSFSDVVGAYEYGLCDGTLWPPDIDCFYQLDNGGLANSVLQTQTIYEAAANAGKTSTIVFNMYSSKNHASNPYITWIKPSASDLYQFVEAELGGDPADYDISIMDKTVDYINAGNTPHILTIYFAGHDVNSHKNGVVDGQSSQQQEYYLKNVIDPQIGRLLSALRNSSSWNYANTVFVIIADHGQTDVPHEDTNAIDIETTWDDELEDVFQAVDYDVLDNILEDTNNTDSVIGLNGGLAHIYVRRGAGNSDNWQSWSGYPDYSDDLQPLAQAFWDANQYGSHEGELKGALDLILVRKSRENSSWQAPYEVYLDGGSTQSLANYLSTHSELNYYVDALNRINNYNCQRSGDILLISKYDGPDNQDGQRYYFSGEHNGMHGSLNQHDSYIPLIFAQPGGTTYIQGGKTIQQAESVDMAPTVASILGFTMSQADGKNLLAQVTSPTAPSNPGHTANTTSSITWSWQDNSNNEDGFKVHDSNDVVKVSTGPNVTTATESGLSANTRYTRHIHAFKEAGESSPSSEVSFYTSIETPNSCGFGAVTTNTIELIAQGSLSNLGSGSSGVYFDSTTSGGDTGINQWIQSTTDIATSLSPNTEYAFQVKARNGDQDETPYSPSFSKYTLAKAPAVTCDKNTNTNYPLGTTFTFTNTAGWGQGNLAYYRYLWDTNSTHAWSDTESKWTSGTFQATPLSVGSYYLHLKSYNAEGVSGGSQDYGPYFVTTPTPTPDINQDGKVDELDLNILLDSFEVTDFNPLADLDGDNDVDYDDFLILIEELK